MDATAALLRSILAPLDLCRKCSSRLLGPNDSQTLTRPTQLEVKYIDTQLSGVDFVTCDFKNVTFKGCNFTDVTFVNCTFSDVQFKDIKLERVRFRNIDFKSVSLRGMEFDSVTWCNTSLEHALVVHGKSSPYTLRVPKTAAHSATKCEDIGVIANGSFKKVPGAQVHLQQANHKPSLHLLPVNVLDRILHFVYPSRSEFIWIGTAPAMQGRGQTTWNQGLLSYHCSQAPIDTDQPLRPRIRLCKSLLLVSRTLSKIAYAHVYNRAFAFSSPSSCLAFLHDHRNERCEVTTIGLQFNEGTDIDHWKRLMNVLVHERPDLRVFGLFLDRSFLGQAPWADGMHAVLDWKGHAGVPFRSFVEQVARLPMGVRPDNSTQSITSRTIVKLGTSVELEDDMSEVLEFRKALCKWIKKLSEDRRRWEVPINIRYGTCTQKCLEKSCYWEKRVCR